MCLDRIERGSEQLPPAMIAYKLARKEVVVYREMTIIEELR